MLQTSAAVVAQLHRGLPRIFGRTWVQQVRGGARLDLNDLVSRLLGLVKFVDRVAGSAQDPHLVDGLLALAV